MEEPIWMEPIRQMLHLILQVMLERHGVVGTTKFGQRILDPKRRPGPNREKVVIGGHAGFESETLGSSWIGDAEDRFVSLEANRLDGTGIGQHFFAAIISAEYKVSP